MRDNRCLTRRSGRKIPSLKAGVTDKSFIVRICLVQIGLLFAIASPSQNSRFKPLDFSDSVYQVSGKKLILPVSLMACGFAQFSIAPLADLNLRLRNEITARVTTKTHIDNYSQYAPAAAVYALNLAGIKGKHGFLDRSIILATSAAIMSVTVTGIKQLTHVQRPDGSSFDAFPSGHTATAFVCAEFLYQEYKDVSIWYGIAGYTVAAGTGFLRMYNNRHWLTDVVAGAGFGILSTRLAYWMFPKIKKLLFKDIRLSFSIMPPTDFRYAAIR
jgi:membrane-associated phospholipid phosphatase